MHLALHMSHASSFCIPNHEYNGPAHSPCAHAWAVPVLIASFHLYSIQTYVAGTDAQQRMSPLWAESMSPDGGLHDRQPAKQQACNLNSGNQDRDGGNGSDVATALAVIDAGVAASKAMWAALSKLPSLRRLRLKGGCITTVDLEGLTKLTQLRWLKISDVDNRAPGLSQAGEGSRLGACKDWHTFRSKSECLMGTPRASETNHREIPWEGMAQIHVYLHVQV